MSDTPSRVSPSATPAKERQFQSVSVTRFEIDHLRNLVVLLDHNPLTKHHAASLQQWIEDKTSRPSIESRAPTRGSEEELGKLLGALISKAIFRGRDGHGGARLINGSYEERQKAVDDARSAVESYVSRLRDERDALRKISENYEMLSRGINENSGECSPSCNSYGHDEHCEYVDDAATIRIQQEKLEALRAALQGTDTELSQVRAALASLKEQQLTPEEASEFLDRAAIYDDGSAYIRISIDKTLVAKLRLLSTSDSEQK